MRQEIRHFEPFILLPLGKIQEKLFFIHPALKEDYAWIKGKIFSDMENKVILNHVIRVIRCKKSVIIAHMYPLQYKEPISDRGGQVMVIGFIISKKLLRNYYEGVVFRVDNFLALLEQTVKIYFNLYSQDIATDFVKMVNMKVCDQKRAFDLICAWAARCNRDWDEYIWNKAQKIIEPQGKKTITVKGSESFHQMDEIYKHLLEDGFAAGTIILVSDK